MAELISKFLFMIIYIVAVYQAEGLEEKHAVFWGDRGMGWQSREIKLKELKHEGHIALGK
jgi:hypothetical protein